MTKRLVISRGGQISVPAAVRKRWETRTVLAEDHGDRLVLRPAPDDPIAAVRGIFAREMGHGPTIDELRQAERSAEAEREHILAAADEEQIEWIALPDSQGHRYSRA